MSRRILRVSCASAIVAAVLGAGCSKQESPVAPPAPGSAHVVSVWPPPRATGVLEQEDLWAAFDTALDPATVDDHHVFLKLDTQRIPISVRWDGATRRVVIHPQVPLTHARTHTVELSSSLRAADGATLTGGYTWQFRVTGAADPIPLTPVSGAADESPVVMLEWQGTEIGAGTIRYELRAGTDSAAVAARTSPVLAVTTSAERLTSAPWPMGTTIYWAVTTTNSSTGDTRFGPVASFTTVPAGTPTVTERIPLLDWGYVGSGRPVTCNSVLVTRPDYLATIRWNIRARYPDRKLASLDLELGVDDTLGSVRVWGTRDQWQPCSMTLTGPPAREPSWGFGPGTVSGSRRLGFRAVALASFVDAISRGRAVDGFILSSDVQRVIGTSGANASFLDITSYAPPVARAAPAARMAPSGETAAPSMYRLHQPRSLAGTRGTL